MNSWKEGETRRDGTELTIEKALEFAGDNSNYQKRRLLLLTIMILALAILTSKVTMMGTKITMLFLLTSGIGQIYCLNYLNILAITPALGLFAVAAALLYPFS